MSMAVRLGRYTKIPKLNTGTTGTTGKGLGAVVAALPGLEALRFSVVPWSPCFAVELLPGHHHRVEPSLRARRDGEPLPRGEVEGGVEHRDQRLVGHGEVDGALELGLAQLVVHGGEGLGEEVVHHGVR